MQKLLAFVFLISYSISAASHETQVTINEDFSVSPIFTETDLEFVRLILSSSVFDPHSHLDETKADFIKRIIERMLQIKEIEAHNRYILLMVPSDLKHDEGS